MTPRARKLTFSAIWLLAATQTTSALVGTLDTENKFPFVVVVEIQNTDGGSSRCSGVIFGHVLSTAGHCLYSEERGRMHGWAKKVTVPYVDVLGERRVANALKMFVPKAYI